MRETAKIQYKIMWLKSFSYEAAKLWINLPIFLLKKRLPLQSLNHFNPNDRDQNVNVVTVLYVKFMIFSELPGFSFLKYLNNWTRMW